MASFLGFFKRYENDENGSAAALVLIILSLTSIVVSGVGVVAMIASNQVRAAAVADLAALAATDAQLGFLVGLSGCEAAGSVAKQNGANLKICVSKPQGSVVTLVIGNGIFATEATSAAGPP